MSGKRKPIRVTALQEVEWGADRRQFMLDLIRQAAEHEYGEPLEWQRLVHIDGMELVSRAEVAEQERQKELEWVARSLCVAAGEPPDVLVSWGEPYRYRNGYVAQGDPTPNWKTYLLLAEAAEQANKSYSSKEAGA